jgi:phage gp37-like protein
MAYTVEQIEDALMLAVSTLKTSLNVRDIKTYQGELDENDLSRITARLPAIYVIYGGSGYAKHGRRKIERMSWWFFVCDAGVRDEAEARRGGNRNPGTYAMLDGIRDLVYGRQLSMEITPFEMGRTTPVYHGKGISIYGAEYTTEQAHLYPAG